LHGARNDPARSSWRRQQRRHGKVAGISEGKFAVTNEIIELATRAGEALRGKGLLLSTAESCTGGGVAQAVTEIAGSSEWFDCGFVTYSNASKSALLGVPAALIAQCGAVSEEVAAAMAQGALANSHAGVALSTTGIAGPGGAVPGKPVGTVCFAWSRGAATRTDTQLFAGDRQAVREQSVRHALHGLLRFIE
jgi:nicotinamide-nucleotide amidase